MPPRGFFLLVLGLGPIALTACLETRAATAQPTTAVPAIGVDLGNSARIPQIAGLAGEGEGYGRTEPGTTTRTAHGPMAGMSHETGMQMNHGSMPGMNHGSTSGMQMDHGAMSSMDQGSMDGMQMDHGAMPGMSHDSTSGMQTDHDPMPGRSSKGGVGHGSTGRMQMDHGATLGMSHSSKGRMAANHASMPGMTHSPGGGLQMAHSGHAHAQGTGTVNSVDAAAHKVNVSHGPISAIGLPAMTMDFAVGPSVDLQAVKPGSRVNFTIEQGAGGMYVIQSITPAGGGRQ